MLPGVNDYHNNHAAPTRPTSTDHSKYSPAGRSPTAETQVAVPDGIYNPPPASAANAAKPGPAAIGGEVRDMMELMHRREAAPFASTDAARADQRTHEAEILSAFQAERRRRLDMEAEYERKRQLGLLDRSGLGGGFADSYGGGQATVAAAGGKWLGAPPSHAADAAAPRYTKFGDDLVARAAAESGSVMAPRIPPGAGDGTLHRTPEFRLASTAAETEETWDTKIKNVERFAIPQPPAAPLPPARVVPLPPAPPAAPQEAPPLKKQGMAASGEPRVQAAAAARRQKGAAPRQQGLSAAVEQTAAGAAGKGQQQNFTLHPQQPGDVELRSPQMIDPNEVVILPPGPFSGSTASMAPFRRERGW